MVLDDLWGMKMKKPLTQIGLGIALGAGIGAATGVLAGHIAVWLAAGIAIGVAIGSNLRGAGCAACAAVHQTHEPEHRSPTTNL
jgi:hypothetical protein